MDFNGPGSARKAVLFLIFSIFIISARSQHESHEDSNGKNHLRGIRKLSIQRLNQARPIQVTSYGGRRFFSNTAPAKDSGEDLGPSHWSRRRIPARRAPTAVVPIMDSQEEIKFERMVNLLPVKKVVHAAPTQIVSSGQRPRVWGRSEVRELPYTPTLEEIEKQRQERIQARWRKIGPLRGHSKAPYSNMRIVHFAQPIAWTHVPTTVQTTSAPRTVPRIITTSTVTPRTRSTLKAVLPDLVKPTTEAPMIRRINKHPIHVETPNPVFGRRTFGKQTFFNGPILEEETPEIPPSKPITVSGSSESFAEVEDGPIIKDTSKNDYHSRSINGLGAAPIRRFKLTNKITSRPRLKIRRPEEQFAARGDHNEKSYPLAIPELAPLSSQDGRRPLPSSTFEEPGPFMARHRFNTGAGVRGLRPLPRGEQNIQVEPPRPPSVTDWGDVEDFSEPSTEDSGIVGSGAGFGGDIGTPPPGFKESFGLNGANMGFTTEATTKAPTTTRRTTTRPPPPPEEPFVIPENSGLRPVAPPKEFVGGFGSSRGSHLSGFGTGPNLGGGVFGTPPASVPKKPKKPKKNKKPPPEPEFKEEDFFTGESALTPNRRGPSGDGFGPPVPVGVPAPPPVPAVGVGGSAAGIPPEPYHRMIMNENSATTVKPSALLSILNKADEGFNQAITHFEEGTPIESAAIDILEVALGSERLDSQAKLLGHVDRTFGLDNLQRLQRWANTGGAFDMLKEQFAKFAKNYKVPEPDVTLPPQLEYLFAPTG